MTETADFLVRAFLIRTGATAVMDIWAAARTWLRGSTPPDYALVGVRPTTMRRVIGGDDALHAVSVSSSAP